LDIVKIKYTLFGNKFYHFGIYLGNNKICHFSGINAKQEKSTEENEVIITE
jgi:cell wall-associated NlpC family hydrolase